MSVLAFLLIAGASAYDPTVQHLRLTHPELDFWVGEWDVQVGGRMAGTNRIEKILDGCAVMEFWTGADGGEGRGGHREAPTWLISSPISTRTTTQRPGR